MKLVPLNKLAKISAGNSAPQDKKLFENGVFPFIRTSDVGALHHSKNLTHSRDMLNHSGIVGLRKYPKGTILFPKSGASTYLNHRVIMGIDAYVVSHLAAIEPLEDVISSEYLYYFLTTIDAKKLNQDQDYPSLKNSTIGEIMIPLVDLELQHKVVQKLNTAFESIDQAIKLSALNLKNSQILFDATLKYFFESAHPDWLAVKLKAVTTKIGSGATPKGGKSAYKSEGIALVRSLNIYDKYFKYEKLAYIDDYQAAKLANVTLAPEDVLLNITGASIARCNIVPNDCLPGRVNQHVSILRVIGDRLLPGFLHYLLISEPYKSRLLSSGEGKGSTRQALTKTQLQDFEVSIPASVNQQREFTTGFDELLRLSQGLKQLYDQKISMLLALRQSLLAKAFDEDGLE